jgi:hypothetical protein
VGVHASGVAVKGDNALQLPHRRDKASQSNSKIKLGSFCQNFDLDCVIKYFQLLIEIPRLSRSRFRSG